MQPATEYLAGEASDMFLASDIRLRMSSNPPSHPHPVVIAAGNEASGKEDECTPHPSKLDRYSGRHCDGRSLNGFAHIGPALARLGWQ